MRHRKKRTRFGRQKSHRLATLRSLARGVILHQRIKTTHVKAKEARRVVEALITIGKDGSLSARRKAFAILGDRTLVAKLFKEIAPLFTQKKGGYTRIIPFNFRKGDGASMVFLELTEKKPEEKPLPAKKTKEAKKPLKPATKPKLLKKEPHKAAPEVSPEVKEEKTIEKAKKEKARDEARKIEKQKGFLRKVHGFFRRKTNM